MATITVDSSDFVEAPEHARSLRFEEEKQQANFELGVSMAIHSWDALETAVANGWGGANSEEKRDWITAIVVDLFDEKIVDVQLVEDTILNAMVDEFDVNVEDDSSLPIADKVIKFYRQCVDKDYSKIHQLYQSWQQRANERAAKRAQLAVQVQQDPTNPDDSDDSDADEEDGDDEEIPQLQGGEPAKEDVEMDDVDNGPIIDDDGFELVQKKGRRRH
jgi:pre-rRNA-processing protein TSR2